MHKVIQSLNSTIIELDKLDNILKNLNEDELELAASSYPFNIFFHEMVSEFNKWKREIEN